MKEQPNQTNAKEAWPPEDAAGPPSIEEDAGSVSDSHKGPRPAAAGVDSAPQPAEPAVLRLRGIPFAANESNIYSFFATAESIKQPTDVYICRRNGRSTGECYVVLPASEAAISARQQLDKRHMGHRYIEIFEATMADLEAVRKILEDSQPKGHCLRLRGLPFTATASDVVAFFEGVPLAEGPAPVVFTFTADGRPTGEAYVEVADEAAAAAAMQRHKERMGSRYIEVFASTKHDLLQAAQQAQFQRGQAALRQRWAALAGVPGVAGMVPGASAGAMGLAGTLGQFPAAASYARDPVGVAVAGSGAAGTDQLLHAFGGMTISASPTTPPRARSGHAARTDAAARYGAAAAGMAPLQYYSYSTDGVGPGSGAAPAAQVQQPQYQQQPAQHAQLYQQEQYQQQAYSMQPYLQPQYQQQAGMVLAGYTQQGPYYVPAVTIMPHQQPQQMQQQQQQSYMQAAPLHWQPYGEPPGAAAGAWAHSVAMQPDMAPQPLPTTPFSPAVGGALVPGITQVQHLPRSPGAP